MTRRNPSTLRAIERDVYKADRTLGDLSALQRGGVSALLLRLARRQVRRKVGQATRGWL